MKVRDLINILEEMDPESDVWIMAQQSWPYECSVAGVCQRIDIAEPDATDGKWTDRDRWGARDTQLPMNDVFIVEGSQMRYGNKLAWDAARK